jgi:hypothetical protein
VFKKNFNKSLTLVFDVIRDSINIYFLYNYYVQYGVR